MDELKRHMPWSWKAGETVEPLVEREWLVTNGLGGYATGTLAGVCTRRYHGYLIAALPAPLGRRMMLNHLTEQVRLPDRRTVQIGGDESASSGLDLRGVDFLQEFCLEAGLPMWRYRIDGHVLEKRVLMLHQQNTVHVNYRLAEGTGPVHMKLRLAVHFRGHDAPVSGPLGNAYVFSARDDQFELSDGTETPNLRFQVQGPRAAFTVDGQQAGQIIVVTHNANIAVLSDAEQIVVLKSTSDKATITNRGSIDDAGTRDAACEILEGAPEAFRLRARLYGMTQ